MAGPMPRMHSAMVPTAVLRSVGSLLLASLRMLFSKILKSSAKEGPRAAARPITASRVQSTTSQSYSADSSRSDSSVSRSKSDWQGWERRRRCRRVSVRGLRMVGEAIREGPVTLRVAARERQVSVTVLLCRSRVLADAWCRGCTGEGNIVGGIRVEIAFSARYQRYSE